MWAGHGYFSFLDLISAITEITIPAMDNANAIIEIVFIILSVLNC